VNISEKGIALVRSFEGFRADAYKDSAGIPTIGYGTTYGVKMGQHITMEEAEDLLKADLQHSEEAVNALVKVPINQNQFDALVSFTYNVGVNALAKSTLLHLLNEGATESAAFQFLQWIWSGNNISQGLLNRRGKEKALFLEAV
jgi:lysozyme